MAANQQPQQGQQTTGQTQKNVPAGQQSGDINVQRGGRQTGGLLRHEEAWPSLLSNSPFGLMRRMMEDMDRMFDDFSLSRRGLGTNLLGGLTRGIGGQLWAPQVDVFERDNNLIVRADLPGLTKNDINIELQDEVIVLQGERKSEHEGGRRGVHWAERNYGSFYRAIPLPEGISTDDAKATFNNGVLEIVLKLPEQQQQRSRRLEIQEGGGTTGTAASPTASTTRH